MLANIHYNYILMDDDAAYIPFNIAIPASYRFALPIYMAACTEGLACILQLGKLKNQMGQYYFQ